MRPWLIVHGTVISYWLQSKAPALSSDTALIDLHLHTSRYDCIWIQWCLLYLTDTDVQSMFDRASAGLKPDGLIIVKENVCKEGFIVDNDDSSLTRSNAYMLDLFEKSNMQVN